MPKKLRYRLHWAAGEKPHTALKWVIYDWTFICPVAYAESRVGGRQLCEFLNRRITEDDARADHRSNPQ